MDQSLQNNDIEIWHSEYELRQFIHITVRWPIQLVYESRTEIDRYSIFDHDIKIARVNFEKFSTQLRKKLTENENCKAIGIDLKNRFILMIDQYLQWYEDNKDKLQKFQPYCPYTFMLSIIESTKDEILKYFPDISQSQQPEFDSSNKLLENPRDDIFNSDFAFTLFEKMRSMYESSTTKQADYSNLFDIMRKDGFVVCSGSEFIAFLGFDCNISIIKIDSSKTGNKRKTDLYNSIKENLKEKHAFSTKKARF